MRKISFERRNPSLLKEGGSAPVPAVRVVGLSFGVFEVKG